MFRPRGPPGPRLKTTDLFRGMFVYISPISNQIAVNGIRRA